MLLYNRAPFYSKLVDLKALAAQMRAVELPPGLREMLKGNAWTSQTGETKFLVERPVVGLLITRQIQRGVCRFDVK